MTNDDLARRVTIGQALISLVPEANHRVTGFDTPEIDSVRLALVSELAGDVAHAHTWGTGQLESELFKLGAQCMEWLDDLSKDRAR